MNRDQANIDNLDAIPSHIQKYIKHLYEKKKQSVSQEISVPTTSNKFFQVVQQVQQQQNQEKQKQSLLDQANKYLTSLYAGIETIDHSQKNLFENKKIDQQRAQQIKEKNIQKSLVTYASTNLSIQEIENEEQEENEENEDFNFDKFIRNVNNSEQRILQSIDKLLTHSNQKKKINQIDKQYKTSLNHKKKTQQLVNQYFMKKLNDSTKSSYLLLHQDKGLQTSLTRNQFQNDIQMQSIQIDENSVAIQTQEKLKKKVKNQKAKEEQNRSYTAITVPIWERVDYIQKERQAKIDQKIEEKKIKEENYLNQFKKKEEKLSEEQLKNFLEKQQSWKKEIDAEVYKKLIRKSYNEEQKKKKKKKFENEEQIAERWEQFYDRQLSCEKNKMNKIQKVRQNEFSFQPKISK